MHLDVIELQRTCPVYTGNYGGTQQM